MLFNNIDTAGIKVNLESGIYYFHLFGLETVDLNDYIRIIGENNFLWRYAEEVDYREPYFDNEYTEYADTVGQGLTVVFKVLEAGEFTIRTDDTFEYPGDDTPSNPIVDLEILQAGDYSAVAEDWIGAVDNNLLSTGEGAVTAETIANDFFHGHVDLTQYGVEGTAALWVTEPGIHQVEVTVDGTANLLFWDGSNLVPFTVTSDEGEQEFDNSSFITHHSAELYFETVSDEWGFVVLDKDASNVATAEFDNFIWYDSPPTGVEMIKYQETAFPISVSLTSDRSLGDVDLYEQETRISSGSGDLPVSTLSSELGIDLRGLGTEGSYATWNVENGVYEIT